MFDLFKETDSEEKCLAFLQKNKCLPTEKDCPSCGEKMVMSERVERGSHTCSVARDDMEIACRDVQKESVSQKVLFSTVCT